MSVIIAYYTLKQCDIMFLVEQQPKRSSSIMSLPPVTVSLSLLQNPKQQNKGVCL